MQQIILYENRTNFEFWPAIVLPCALHRSLQKELPDEVFTTLVGFDFHKGGYQTIGGLVSKETVSCVGRKVKH